MIFRKDLFWRCQAFFNELVLYPSHHSSKVEIKVGDLKTRRIFSPYKSLKVDSSDAKKRREKEAWSFLNSITIIEIARWNWKILIFKHRGKKLENVRIKMHELHSPDNFAILHLLHVSFRLISIFL